ncbi:ribosome hibernation-promoting factor, HPF/YfiA family [Microlunatus sp. Y2014]|uniref:ribosome hibernation-promoting factor, HPF/YfiA family n=1 Tax=Microlunatus sp. Y2014 TaxID=3418488 RepID=UPI003DA74C3D
MDVVVKGHHVTVTEAFRTYVEERISRLEKLDHRVIRVEVKVTAEQNRRKGEPAGRVEITVHSRGPVMRAEAAAEEKQAAFDMALDRLMAQLRKAADRRRVHRGRHTPRSVSEATAGIDPTLEPVHLQPVDEDPDHRTVAGMDVEGDGPLVVREKVHKAQPMTLDQALYEMELVGHDFYLFVDAESGRPSVVYRRKGYDYGVIQVETDEDEAAVG